MTRYVLTCALLLLAPTAFGQPIPISRAAPTTAVDAVNDDIGRLWTRARPDIEAFLAQQVSSQLPTQSFGSGSTSLNVLNVRRVDLGLQDPVGFLTHDTSLLHIAMPLRNTWWLELEADVDVSVNLLFTTLRRTLPVTIRVEDVRGEARLELDDSDPGRIQVRRSSSVTVDFRVRVQAPGALGGLIANLLEPVANRIARQMVDRALRDMIAGYAGRPGPVHGAGAPRLTDSGAPTAFSTVVARVDQKIRAHHLPNGLLARRTSTAAIPDESWEDAYGPGGPGLGGGVRDAIQDGDCAIWTGHYLASQALRYGATQSPDALANVRHALGGIAKLIEVNSDTGLLARRAAPTQSPLGQDIVRVGVYGRRVINGLEWVGHQGHNGISRDQYSGVFFGLALTYDLVNDPVVRVVCARLVGLMLDYLVARDWYIDEDRPTLANGGNPTPWTQITYQKLAFLLIGERMHPGRYASELALQSLQAPTAWAGIWMTTFDTESYYKFNLSHIGLYNYFRLETDPGRWQDLARANLPLRRYTGHHQNPHFDLIQANIEPALRVDTFPAVREEIRRYLRRNHRHVAPPVVDLSGVTWVNVTSGGNTVTMPSEPLDIPLRKITGNFLWQRSPFEPATAGRGNAQIERVGLDLVLPYWMGRYHGAF